MSEWIKVADRFPKRRTAVLVYISQGIITMAALLYKKHDLWQSWWDLAVYRRGEITHWMPFPEPPTG